MKEGLNIFRRQGTRVPRRKKSPEPSERRFLDLLPRICPSLGTSSRGKSEGTLPQRGKKGEESKHRVRERPVGGGKKRLPNRGGGK